MSGAAIRVVEDEVIFTYRVPPGKTVEQVYLVGDFNNWNATMEKMLRDGDVFEMSLFLVEGNYYYKFVVDGEWVVDPDNPGSDPERGSPLALVEQTGGLTVSTEDPQGDAVPTLTPLVRYIGALYEDNGGWSRQRVDVTALFERDRLRGRAVLSSRDDTWRDRLGDVETTLNRGFVEVDLGALRARGYERDSVWTSSDPVGLIGNDGVFNYNAGFDRSGVSLEYNASKFVARVLYDDQVETPAAVPQLPVPMVPDTSLYAWDGTASGSDRTGMEVVAQLGKLRVGYVRRSNRGLHVGRFAEVAADTTAAATVETRENRSVSLYWMRTSSMGPADALTFAWGRGASHLQSINRIGNTAPFDATPVDTEQRIQKTWRALAMAEGAMLDSDALSWQLAWEFVRFDFDNTVAASGPEADVHRGRIFAGYARSPWRVGISTVYTNQDYGGSPAELHIDAPARNPWLGARDRLAVSDIVALDERDYAVAAIDAAWQGIDVNGGGPAAALTAGAVNGGGGEGVSGGLRHLWVQATVQVPIGSGFYGEADGRLARYDKPSWQLDGTYASGYLELGYRWRSLLVNAGWGLDPLVFDPVINDYARIGRTDLLRGALGDGVDRTAGAAVGAALEQLERQLRDSQAIKVECVVRF